MLSQQLEALQKYGIFRSLIPFFISFNNLWNGICMVIM